MKLNRGFLCRLFLIPDGVAPSGNASQQSQQSADQPADPFANIDFDMLDESTRAKLTSAKEQFATIAKAVSQKDQELATARGAQSEADRRLAEFQRGQQQQVQTQPLTLEQEITQEYIEQGLEPEAAKRAAKIQAKVLGKFESRFKSEIGRDLQPMAQSVGIQQAAAAFAEAQQSDRIGAMEIPEVAQKVWETAQGMASNGQIVSKQILANLKGIYYTEHLEAGGKQAVAQPQQNQGQQHQGTRFTFPGAGSFAQRQPQPTQQRGYGSLDPETQAALDATLQSANWPKKKN